MRKNFKKLVVLWAVAVLLVPAVLYAGFVVKEGDSIKPFGLRPLIKTEDGPQFFHTANYVGDDAGERAKLLIVSFWASWCKPCKKELPLLDEYYKKYKDSGLMVFGVCVDKDKDGIEKARKFATEHNLGFPLLSDYRQLVVKRYFDENVSLPAMLIFDTNGTIVRASSGYSENFPQELETLIRKQLGLPEQKPAAKQDEPKKETKGKKNQPKKSKKHKVHKSKKKG